MLVLTRKLGEEIVLPDQGVSIKVIDVRGGRVRLGIVAPESVGVLRGELLDLSSAASAGLKIRNQENGDVASKSALGRPLFAIAK